MEVQHLTMHPQLFNHNFYPIFCNPLRYTHSLPPHPTPLHRIVVLIKCQTWENWRHIGFYLTELWFTHTHSTHTTHTLCIRMHVAAAAPYPTSPSTHPPYPVSPTPCSTLLGQLLLLICLLAFGKLMSHLPPCSCAYALQAPLYTL